MSCFCRNPVVAVVSLKGVISSGKRSSLSFESVNKNIEAAFNMSNVRAVILSINSPGGSPVQSELISNRIRSLSNKKQIPVYAFIEDCATSGGYWLACSADKIYASQNSIIGSIGVITNGFGFTKLIENHGIERRVYTQGDNKSILDPFLPVKDSDVEILKNVSADIHQSFIDTVKERRGLSLRDNTPDLFSGKVWSGKQAKQIGLIDDIGSMYDILQNKYGDKVVIKHMKETSGFLSSIKEMFSLECHAEALVQSTATTVQEQFVWSRIGNVI